MWNRCRKLPPRVVVGRGPNPFASGRLRKDDAMASQHPVASRPRGDRLAMALAGLLVVVSVLVALHGVQRGGATIRGRTESSTTSIQWVLLAGGTITAVEGVIVVVMLLRHNVAAARRALYVSALTGLIGLVGTAVSVCALMVLRGEE